MTINFKTIEINSEEYLVNDFSEIKDSTGRVVETIENNGVSYIEINWFEGKRLYEKGLFILFAFERIMEDDNILGDIEVLYLDGDSTNTFLSNLTYVFKRPLESIHEGFYKIPRYPKYLISKSGLLLNVSNMSILRWSIFKGNKNKNQTPGYHSCRFKQSGKNTSVYLHRLLCLVFKKITHKEFSKLVVNHINGIKSDNRLDNLEWTTYAENNKHAIDTGLNKIKNQILMRNLLTRKILRFSSISECSMFLGDNRRFYVYERLKDQSSKIYPDYLQFKKDDGGEWPDVDWSIIPNGTDESNFHVATRNVFTGDITIYSTLRECSEATGVSTRVILYHCRDNKILPKNGYNFRFLINANSWPQHTAQCLEIYKYDENGLSGVVMTDVVSGEEKFFPSIHLCGEWLGLDRDKAEGVIQNYITSSKRLYKKQYRLKRYNPLDVITLN